MRFSVTLLLAALTVTSLLASGCADVKATQKVGDFGTAFGATAEEQKAIEWFKTTYGDPTTNNNDPARFVEPLVTTGLSDKNLPVDKVTAFPVEGGSVYFFVIYDNFKKGDPITVSWVYLENGKEVTGVKQEAGGDFGRFIVEFQKPDTGWGKGKQRITVTGDGATANVDFVIGDSLETAPLPYKPAGGGTGNVAGVTNATTTGTLSQPSAIITTVTTGQSSQNDVTTVTTSQNSDQATVADLRSRYGQGCKAGMTCWERNLEHYGPGIYSDAEIGRVTTMCSAIVGDGVTMMQYEHWVDCTNTCYIKKDTWRLICQQNTDGMDWCYKIRSGCGSS